MEIRISVIMGIYNCAPTLAEALDSLLAQTYQGFKVIMCDDGSKDNTVEVAQSYVESYPEKFILIKNEKNMGLNYTLNHCLEYADTEYVARMDGDDISLPTRFQKEIDFLDSHPEYAFVSAPMIHFDEEGEFKKGKGGHIPSSGEDYLEGRTFCHAPVLMTKEAYDSVGGYTISKYLLRLEDQHLWLKLYQKGYRGFNLSECLYMMRDDRNATARRDFKTRRNEMLHRLRVCRVFKLPLWRYAESIVVPMVKWMLPKTIYEKFHRR